MFQFYAQHPSVVPNDGLLCFSFTRSTRALFLTTACCVSVLRAAPERCSSSHVDLPHLEITDTKGSINLKNVYAEENHHSSDVEPPDDDDGDGATEAWGPTLVIVAVCVVGTVFIVVLLIAIFSLMMCMRKEQRRQDQRGATADAAAAAAAAAARAADKNTIHAPFNNDWKKAVDV